MFHHFEPSQRVAVTPGLPGQPERLEIPHWPLIGHPLGPWLHLRRMRGTALATATACGWPLVSQMHRHGHGLMPRQKLDRTGELSV